MIDLAAREATIMAGLKDFQRATVERVIERFRSGQLRVLVADEVGLGKTLIAKGVIAQVARWHKDELHDPLFRVVYVCSNQSIARQNVKKLKIDAAVEIDSDTKTRLTMQTLKFFQQRQKAKAYVQLIPLTPSTSLATTDGQGCQEERALIYAVLRRIAYFRAYTEELSQLLSMNVKSWSWLSGGWIEGEIAQCGEEYEIDVIPRVEKALHTEKYAKLRDQVLRACKELRQKTSASKSAYHIVHHLRRLMADISISYLDPDLVIMDEFQRFRDLIRTDEQTEVGMLAKKFLHETSCKVLLLSATPYKLYATLEDIADHHGVDEQYREFHEVIAFLYGDNAEQRNAFRKAWERYSLALRQLDTISTDEYQRCKAAVEDLLYAVMCRTERLQVAAAGGSIIQSRKATALDVRPEDIRAYIAADAVVQALSVHGKGTLPPVEYVKSAPFLLSFMEQYQLKKLIRRHRQQLLPTLKRATHCWVPREQIERYEEITFPNARLRTLLDEVFMGIGERLLWIPPTLPYYEFGGPYNNSEGFSKVLLFSAWEMVPRMIASLVSYELERRTIGDPAYAPRSSTVEKRYTPLGENQQRFPSRKLEFRTRTNQDVQPESMSLFTLLYPSKKLAELFSPLEIVQENGEHFPVTRESLEMRLAELLSHEIQNIARYQTVEERRKDLSWYWLAPVLFDIEAYGDENVSKWVSALRQRQFTPEDEDAGVRENVGRLYQEHLVALQQVIDHPERIALGPMPDDLVEVLLRQALGSPAVCALRTLLAEIEVSDEGCVEDAETIAFVGAHEIAMAMRGKMNTPEATAIIDRSYQESHEFHWRNVLRYGMDGNLQAVLDEYRHMLCDSFALHESDATTRVRELTRLMSQPLRTKTATYKVDTYSAFSSGAKGESKSLRMRSHYAVGFYNVKSDANKDVQRTDQLRQAFNSPFWPFVLASTSIGQEGLDFHYYCRKIMHWNLPSNPIDLEQREGRINRYKSLAVRHNAVQRYYAQKDFVLNGDPWQEIFGFCKTEEQGEHCELIPYWHLEPEGSIRDAGYIERIVPMYPFSKDEAQYARLEEILALYRLTMGQSRQEELLESIAQHLSTDDQHSLQEWFILLSPFYRDGAAQYEDSIAHDHTRDTIVDDSINNKRIDNWASVGKQSQKRVPSAISHAFQYEYWDAYRAFLEEQDEEKLPSRSRFYWQSYSARIRGFSLDAIYALPHLPGHIAFAYSFSSDGTDLIREIVTRHQQQIEQVLGYQLHMATTAVDGHLWLYTAIKADAWDRTDWPNQFAWYRSKYAEFTKAVTPYIDEIAVKA